MNKLFYCFLLLSLPCFLNAQNSGDRRTLNTKIADVLAKFPAADKTQYDANVDQLQGLGKEGLQQLLGMLAAPGKGDNTAIEYAISAFSSSVMEGKQQNRKMAVDLYCQALKDQGDDVTRTFIIKQLQLVGNDESLWCLRPFLNNENLSGPAARAIAQINGEAAGKMLLQALNDASTKNKASVIEALGYIKYSAAVSAIQNEYAKGDATTKKVAAYALAEIGDPSSAKLLYDAAKAAGFTSDNTGAADAYFTYIQRNAANGDGKEALKLANQLMKETASSKNVHARISALTLQTSLDEKKAMPHLVKALSDKDAAYRGAALKLAEKLRNNATDKEILGAVKKLSPDAKAQVFNYLANTDDKSLASTIDDYVFDGNDVVREAAIKSAAKIGGEDAFPMLISVLQKGNASDIAVAKASLLRINTDNIGAKLAAQIDGLSEPGTIAALEVMSARRTEDGSSKVFELINSSKENIRTAAYKALPQVVNQNDLPRLFGMLGSAKGENLAFVQDAVTSASAAIKDTSERTAVITSELNRASGDNKYLFVPTLAAIGGRDALKKVDEIYANGDQQSKRTVIEALSKNRDARSASMLLQIARSSAENKEAAVDGYIRIIQRGIFPAEQKVVMLQEAMTLATKDSQRKTILQQAGSNVTYLSLMFAGKYLEDPALKQAAAFAVMNIALSNPEFIGEPVRKLLQTASKSLGGQDSEYQQEAIRKHLADMPPGEGFVPMFNGKDLTGWKGLVENPVKRKGMSAKDLAAAQKKADEKVKEGWQVKDGLLVFTGHGDNLATTKQYGDFEMLVDWKITAEGDAGIYLRGTPQVQIWDTSRRDVGAEVGSGGLYNNEKNPSKPLQVADNPVGEWNNFRIIMKGDKVTVYLNGKLVTDNVTLENYWDRSKPIFDREQIELQAHGTYVAYRNLYIKELQGSKRFELPADEKKEGFKVLFDGTNLDEWIGNKKDYVVENNELVVRPSAEGGGGNLFTKDEYSDFNFRFEFMLTPGANNGLGIRAPLDGDAAYTGMELQILDNDADIYKDLKPYQYHGSVYGVIPAKRGFLKPNGEWNQQEVIVKGTKIKVILNGTVILDGDIKNAIENGTLDKQDHPGLKRDKGHIGFLGHGSVLRFRNIRVKEVKLER